MISPDYIEIDGRKIGNGYNPYIVAEMSGNHNRNIKNALALIKSAKECGADAIKLQTYTPDTITINHDNPEFIVNGGIWNGRKLYDLYEEAHTPWEWHEQLFRYAEEIGITIFSSPFDSTAVDFLENLNCKAYKRQDFLIKSKNKFNKTKYFEANVYSYKNKYLLIKNKKFNFLKNFFIFPMTEINKKKFNHSDYKKINVKISNMNMKIVIKKNKKLKQIRDSLFLDKSNMNNYILPSFTKKIFNSVSQ